MRKIRTAPTAAPTSLPTLSPAALETTIAATTANTDDRPRARGAANFIVASPRIPPHPVSTPICVVRQGPPVMSSTRPAPTVGRRDVWVISGVTTHGHL